MNCTWSPFQSETVQEICEHLTPAERRMVVVRAASYGVWVALTVSLPVMALVFSIMASQLRSVPIYLGAAALIVLHLACLPVWLGMQRRFLCSTQWAREQRIIPESLRLFGLNRRTSSA